MQNKPRVQALMGNADGVPQLASEVARALDMSSSTARKYLEELVSEGQASRSRGQVFRHGRYCPAVYYRPVEVSA